MLLEEETKTGSDGRRGGEYTPDSDLAQSTHPFPIIQNDTVEERLREKDSRRKGWESAPVFYVCIVSTHAQP